MRVPKRWIEIMGEPEHPLHWLARKTVRLMGARAAPFLVDAMCEVDHGLPVADFAFDLLVELPDTAPILRKEMARRAPMGRHLIELVLESQSACSA